MLSPNHGGFAKDFLWGTATASYQIEGAIHEDGKGASIWDDYTHEPGRIIDGTNGDIACDHYHRFREDVALMAKFGIKNYRFSISWSRVIPDGTGAVNEKGLQFYSELVDELLAHGIRPFCTIYHWDLPSALHRRGGWLNEDMPEWFANYTRVIAERLGDRVKDFFTINEPQCIMGLGYATGGHAPNVIYPLRDQIRMIHHLLMSHGRAVQVLREIVSDVRVGYAPCADPYIPATNAPADIEAAKKAYYGVSDDPAVFIRSMTWYSDPVILGRYPEAGMARYGKFLPAGWEEDMKIICQPLDYYAQNIYQGIVVRAADNAQGWEKVPFAAGHPTTNCGWPITPDALYWGAKMMTQRYPLPLIISENGMSCHDAVMLDGKVHDPNRIDYTHRYLRALKRAAAEGVPVMGYFYWSFWDNFEWKKGYTERFGLVYVDYQTQERIPKDSAYWYQQVMETNGEAL